MYGELNLLEHEMTDARDHRNIAWDTLLRLLPSSMLGIVFGLLFFKLLDSANLARGLGMVTGFSGTLALAASLRPEHVRQASVWTDARLAGLLSGDIGTTFGALARLLIAMHFGAIRNVKGLVPRLQPPCGLNMSARRLFGPMPALLDCSAGP